MDTAIINLLGLARTAQLAGNQEEALTYFNRVLEVDPTISEAWVGKGKASGWQSSLANIRANEMVVAFNHAIATAPEEEKASLVAELVDEANRLVATLYGMARRQLEEFVALNNMWDQYLGQMSQLINALEQIKAWDPENRTTLENIIHLCKDNIEGISYRDPYDNNVPKAWHLSPEYEALLKLRLDEATEGLRRIDPSYAPPTIEKKEAETCFIVTATMGDATHPTVYIMRQFRDEWLIQRSWGRAAIRRYYKAGPPVARLIAPSVILRRLSLMLIVLPAEWIARKLIKNG